MNWLAVPIQCALPLVFCKIRFSLCCVYRVEFINAIPLDFQSAFEQVEKSLEAYPEHAEGKELRDMLVKQFTVL